MQEVAARVQINSDQTVIVELAEGMPAGQYHAVLQLVPIEESSKQVGVDIDSSKDDVWSDEMAAAWAQCKAEVKQLERTPQLAQTSARSDYHEALIEKYRKQGLIL